jgi:hypothetical protein
MSWMRDASKASGGGRLKGKSSLGKMRSAAPHGIALPLKSIGSSVMRLYLPMILQVSLSSFIMCHVSVFVQLDTMIQVMVPALGLA